MDQRTTMLLVAPQVQYALEAVQSLVPGQTQGGRREYSTLSYRWPFGPIPMGARSPAHISPTRARHGPEYYWARAGTGTIAGPCLGLNPGPWTRPSTTRNSRPDRPDGRHGGPGTAHGPLARPGRQKSRWRRWRAAGPAQRSGRAGM